MGNSCRRRNPPTPHVNQQEAGGAGQGGAFMFLIKLQTQKYKMYWAMLPFHENKIKLGILNVFQMISGLVMLHKTGQSDSNLLSIHRKRKKNASYSTAVQPESWWNRFQENSEAQKQTYKEEFN